ncbi:MAG: exo-alpha-sialidase, partial [Clostridia bacterium]|nr:exo-alpha-sialidase [Clostridia bacterium]
TRIVPAEGSVEVQWIDNGFDGDHTVTVRKRGEDKVLRTLSPAPKSFCVSDLEDLQDYEVTLSRTCSGESVTRLVRTGKMPCDVPVCYLHPDDTAFIFSGNFVAGPSIVRCPSGRLLASLDVFCGHEEYSCLSLLYRSDDGGESWHWLGELFPCYWGRLFIHDGKVYMFSGTNGQGNVMIGRSDDEGENWTAPSTLFFACYRGGYHSAPGSVVEAHGRLWIPIASGRWDKTGFGMSFISAPSGSDLLDPASWEMADFREYDPSWPGAPLNAGPGFDCPGAGIEGNFVCSPDGSLHALYRMDIFKADPKTGKVIVFDVDPADPAAPYKFNSISDCALGSNSKFCVKFDPVTGYYIMIGTEQSLEESWGRTVISLAVSKDLRSWRVAKRLFDYHTMDPAKVGLQYPDWDLDGEDIVMLLRLGFNQSDTHHNSNCIAFSRIKNFRSLL